VISNATWVLKPALKLPRGLNNLWSKGGIQYAMPIR
jgi:hypothetical protein